MQLSIILSVAVFLLASFEQSEAQLVFINPYIFSSDGVIYCMSRTCRNGGICKPDESKENGYSCTCPKGSIKKF